MLPPSPLIPANPFVCDMPSVENNKRWEKFPDRQTDIQKTNLLQFLIMKNKSNEMRRNKSILLHNKILFPSPTKKHTRM